MTRKARVFWPLILVVLLADCTTKRAAVESLEPTGTSHNVVGETVRLTLAFNDRGAMGLPVGRFGKQALGVLGMLVSATVFVGYLRGRQDDVLLGAVASLYMAGALGNAWGRLFSPRGVVDFIDIGWGSHRFWIFNLADISLFLAGGLLILLFTREKRNRAIG